MVLSKRRTFRKRKPLKKSLRRKPTSNKKQGVRKSHERRTVVTKKRTFRNKEKKTILYGGAYEKERAFWQEMSDFEKYNYLREFNITHTQREIAFEFNDKLYVGAVWKGEETATSNTDILISDIKYYFPEKKTKYNRMNFATEFRDYNWQFRIKNPSEIDDEYSKKILENIKFVQPFLDPDVEAAQKIVGVTPKEKSGTTKIDCENGHLGAMTSLDIYDTIKYFIDNKGGSDIVFHWWTGQMYKCNMSIKTDQPHGEYIHISDVRQFDNPSNKSKDIDIYKPTDGLLETSLSKHLLKSIKHITKIEDNCIVPKTVSSSSGSLAFMPHIPHMDLSGIGSALESLA